MAIKKFFMNTTLTKLKEIEGFKEAESNSENNNKNNETSINNNEKENGN